MKTTFIFVRHAQSMAPIEGIVQGRGLHIPLSPVGEEQAIAVGERMKDVSFDRLFSSTSVRTIETTKQIFSSCREVPWERLENLNERSKGDGEGLKKEEFNKKYPEVIEQWKQDIDCRPPGGENFQDVEDRVMPVIHDHLERYLGETLLYVIHGNVIRVILGALMDVPVQVRYRIEQGYCAYNQVTYDHECNRWSIVTVNSCHLIM